MLFLRNKGFPAAAIRTFDSHATFKKSIRQMAAYMLAHRPRKPRNNAHTRHHNCVQGSFTGKHASKKCEYCKEKSLRFEKDTKAPVLVTSDSLVPSRYPQVDQPPVRSPAQTKCKRHDFTSLVSSSWFQVRQKPCKDTHHVKQHRQNAQGRLEGVGQEGRKGLTAAVSPPSVSPTSHPNSETAFADSLSAKSAATMSMQPHTIASEASPTATKRPRRCPGAVEMVLPSVDWKGD